MSDTCVKHHFDMAEGQCLACGYLFCGRCLVFAKGPSKPPYCLNCALTAAGVRSTAANRPLMSPRDIKRMDRERKKSEKVAAKAARKAGAPEPAPAPPSPGVIPAPTRTIPSRSPAAGWGRATS